MAPKHHLLPGCAAVLRWLHLLGGCYKDLGFKEEEEDEGAQPTLVEAEPRRRASGRG